MESFARNHGIHMQWAEKKVRKEDFVQPFLARMEREGRCGVCFIFQSKEQGPTFHSRKPDRIVRDPDHHILTKKRGCFTFDFPLL